jgi:DNA-binding transcriptional regulator YhcF (GntR family)
MFVAQGAKENIIKKRRKEFYDKYVRVLLEEAKSLGISKEELIREIEIWEN